MNSIRGGIRACSESRLESSGYLPLSGEVAQAQPARVRDRQKGRAVCKKFENRTPSALNKDPDLALRATLSRKGEGLPPCTWWLQT